MDAAVNDLIDQYLRNSPVKINNNIKERIKMTNDHSTEYLNHDLKSTNPFKEGYRLNKIKYSQEKDNISIAELMDLVRNKNLIIKKIIKFF